MTLLDFFLCEFPMSFFFYFLLRVSVSASLIRIREAKMIRIRPNPEPNSRDPGGERHWVSAAWQTLVYFLYKKYMYIIYHICIYVCILFTIFVLCILYVFCMYIVCLRSGLSATYGAISRSLCTSSPAMPAFFRHTIQTKYRISKSWRTFLQQFANKARNSAKLSRNKTQQHMFEIIGFPNYFFGW